MANTITEVRLLNVPLTNDYKHTLYFGSKSDQETYFKGKSKEEFIFNNLSYQRQDQYIRIPKEYSKIVDKCNYVMYKNTAYSNKWFYAFITKVEYVNDGLSNVYIETDVMQTWLLDYNVLPSFVEREHVSDDTIGIHTIPEQVELGDYTCQGVVQDKLLAYNLGIVIAATVDVSMADGTSGDVVDKSVKCDNIGGLMYGNIYSGVRYYIYKSTEHARVNSILQNLANKGQADAIVSIFMCPMDFLNYDENGDVWSSKIDGFSWNNSGNDVVRNVKALDGYGPRNNKLLTSPYRYMLASNNAGGSAVYNYEYFSNGECDFEISGTITPGFSARLKPVSYKHITANNEEGLTAGKLPICSWNTDVYTNWLTQNAVNIGVSGLSSAGQIIGGIGLMATGGGALAGAGMIGNGLLGITSSIGQVYSRSMQPPQAEGNLNSGDVTFSDHNLTFTIYHMCIRKEYAKIIDSYFDMFGYKVNEVKVPNVNKRSRFWFTKTIDVNITGSLPQEDLSKIKACYNNGITFWRDKENIYNYNCENYPNLIM